MWEQGHEQQLELELVFSATVIERPGSAAAETPGQDDRTVKGFLFWFG